MPTLMCILFVSLVSVELCGDGNVIIEFIDYGNFERVSREKLFELPADLLTTPIQVT